jgi:hypothetical protein
MNGEVIDLTKEDIPLRDLKLTFIMVNGVLVEVDNDRRIPRIKVNLIREMFIQNKECPLCFTDTVEENRCVATCAHAFCIPCLKNWEDELIAKSNYPYRRPIACPVCHKHINDIIEYSSEKNYSVIQFSPRW